MRRSAGLRRHPLAHLPGRIVTHVLPVAALELRDPIAKLVAVVANDTPWKGCAQPST
jgi:hypothetical protein